MNTVNNSVKQAKKSINPDNTLQENKAQFSNFNFIAPYYNFLQKLVFGKKLQLAQSYFFNGIKNNSSILIVGGGSGEIMPAIFEKCNPKKVVFVEQSSKMIELAKAKNGDRGVEYICRDILEWNSSEKYDVILLPFILDCFSTELVVQLLQKLKKTLHENGQIIFTDFVENSGKLGLSKLLVSSMYLFFKASAKMKASELPDYDLAFERAGFKLNKKEGFVGRLVEGRVYI